ncbi:MAG: tRNA (adenosine(37)-N6)-threonylcarbamoyltransferase complex dimerization subunit type 1 TsaB [Verrucomicrobia bacterium]|jgi:tRNA threonylcarbamoyl adenosine modification protein YeaZ|nr:tRNA (adenosine(37)-N6)-threonylcarbamoyltransferase complex dimerization subunit type 1 TsaB [Verrucomicrobiota bacterium]
MKILALEFSSPQRSVALVDAALDGTVLHASEVVRSGGRATPALAMIEELLDHAGIGRESIECLAVGRGPGSYHGIRVAIALAQGWQLARHTPLLGVSSADGIAAQAWRDGIRGRVTAAIDAQRQELYLADYDLRDDGWQNVQPLRIVPVKELSSASPALLLVIGPEITRWFPHGTVVFPRAETLGRLAATRTGFTPGEKLEPIYLRPTTFVKAQPPSFTHETAR